MSASIDTRRFARHLNLGGVGERGQRRLASGAAEVGGVGLRGWVARRYLEAGGVGRVSAGAPTSDPAWVSEATADEACRAVIGGAVEALAAMRALLGDETTGQGS